MKFRDSLRFFSNILLDEYERRRAFSLIREILQKNPKFLQGFPPKPLAVAICCVVKEEKGESVSLRELIRCGLLEHEQINLVKRYMRKIKALLGFKYNSKEQIRKYIRNANLPIPHLHSVGSINKVKLIAEQLLDKPEISEIFVGQSPRVSAGALLYAAARILKIPLSQKDIAYSLDVSEVSIRNRYKEIIEKSQIEKNLYKPRHINHKMSEIREVKVFIVKDKKGKRRAILYLPVTWVTRLLPEGEKHLPVILEIYADKIVIKPKNAKN